MLRPARGGDPPEPPLLPVIVLDPGHGGVDGGAYGLNGAVEKTLVFAFADTLRPSWRRRGTFRVVMTRVGDQYVSLEDRVAKARATPTPPCSSRSTPTR